MATNIRGSGLTSSRSRSRLINHLREQGVSSEEVLNAMNQIPRHIFVDEAIAHRAYDDTALPIGFGQTVSQPIVVAHMTQAITESGRRGSVLEIGTGSGYQTAVLACLFDQVYSIERIANLANAAQAHVELLELNNVTIRHGDGYRGWKDAAPFDAVIVTAAPSSVPSILFEQLQVQGRLVVPVGPSHHQELKLFKQRQGKWRAEKLMDVVFVPFVPGTSL